ncbi:MAG: hypothetical protein HGB12_04405 [Bacteroidetes bacterium]|nr:hypothetical protein [Bacteroidota bacterium]
MKKLIFKIFAAIIIISTVLTGCGLKKMIKKYDTVKYEVTPNVLETHGGKISVTVKGNIPLKYFNKKATVEFSPILKYASGTTALKSITLQGEKVKGEGTVIKKNAGGSFTYTDVINYNPDMNKSELTVNAKAVLNKKSALLGEKKLADGVIYTSERVQREEETFLVDYEYDKETIIAKNADIYFAKGLSDLNLKKLPLNKNEENAAKLKGLIEFLKNNWKIKNIDISAWASPEGEETFNQGLSDKRSKTADKYIKEQIKNDIVDKAKANKEKVDLKKIDLDIPTSALVANGEDWDGFMKAIENSDIKEKNTILNVVNSQTDLLKKEKEINNMTVIYPQIEDVILPPLRKSIITINFFEPKKTDQQIAMFATTAPDSLKKDELLYAATLTDDLATKLKIYEATIMVYPSDWKAYNNAAYICLKLGKLDEASSYLEKANSLVSNNGKVINNLGVVASWKKEYDNAKAFYETAKGLGVNTDFNLGIISIRKGDYANALSLFSTKTCMYNIALAQLLSGTDAVSTLECTNPKTAAVYYLLAVAGARANNTSLIFENLPKAISEDASYREQAKDDREFLKYNSSAEFLNAIK